MRNEGDAHHIDGDESASARTVIDFCPSSAAAQQEIVSLPTRAGVTQSFFLTSIPQTLQAVALLFPGSGGLIQLRTENGKPRFNQSNFLVRSRPAFIKRGVAAAIIDAPSDQQSDWGMSDEFRLGNEHLSDISRVIEELAKRFPEVPLFLIGTSRGSISAAALSSRLSERTAGTVLTATMFRHTPKKSKEPGEGLSKFDFATVKVPLLLVHHVSDQCASTPYGDAARLSEKFPLISVFGRSHTTIGPMRAI
jgi:hypothetical protein